MAVTIFLTKRNKTIIREECDIDIIAIIYIHFIALAQQCRADAGARVNVEHFELGLHSIQTDNDKGVVAIAPFKYREVYVVAFATLHLSRLSILDIVDMNRNGRIGFSGFRIFISILKVVRVGILVEREHFYIALIESDPSKTSAVGAPLEISVCTELLFIHPIRSAVDNLVFFAIFRNSGNGIIIEFFQIEIVIISKSHHSAVW